MKRKILAILIFFISIDLIALTKTNKKFVDFDCFTIMQSDLWPNENLKDILKKFSRLEVFYKLKIENNTPYISELYYVFMTGSDKYILGGFIQGVGFVDENMNPVFNEYVDTEDFIKTDLLGLSIFTLRSPFSLIGIAKTKKGEVYTTENLIDFSVNPSRQKLELYRFEL